ncbi:MAG: vanadium-dependent haloperoxidase [Pseudomonadota bacterium]
MTRHLTPKPDKQLRETIAKRVREKAAEVAQHQIPTTNQLNNGEAKSLTPPFGTFTKGLHHDEFGRVSISDLEKLIKQLNQKGSGDETPFPGTYGDEKLPATFDIPLHPDSRRLESPLAGHVFEINGPDADAVAMPPAPRIGSHELIAEMAEVYAMALLRDKHFTEWETAAADLIAKLKQLPFFSGQTDDGINIDDLLPERVRARRHARFQDGETELNAANLFRGSTPGAKHGPYISQFMLIGNRERQNGDDRINPQGGGAALENLVRQDAETRSGRFVPQSFKQLTFGANPGDADGHKSGYVLYGQQVIPQFFVPHKVGVDHMTDVSSWLAVQNGEDRKDRDSFEADARFVSTPRDLATYVHFDALYQAYLNACLILIGQGATTDVGLPEGPGHPTRDGFATFGGPHVLTLVTEVSTRALKAVRRQKYQVHLRARPEAVAHAIALAWKAMDGTGSVTNSHLGTAADALKDMATALNDIGLLGDISGHNKEQNNAWDAAGVDIDLGPLDESHNALLPMAFPEGSPMHPAYGAGHATVAGACTTVLKAFFEMYKVDEKVIRGKTPLKEFIDNAINDYFKDEIKFTEIGKDGIPDIYVPDQASDGKVLTEYDGDDAEDVTLQGELDKLAANIAIGRDFAGVHYYTDYYESLRMGERIAVGLLREQMLTYREPVTMRFTSFDGDYVMVSGSGGSRGLNDAEVHVWDSNKRKINFADWWSRGQADDDDGVDDLV